MAADQHDLLRPAAPGDLADHVLRGVLAIPAGVHGQAHGDRTARQQARELVGIGNAQRRRRYRGESFVVAGDAGVRHAVVVGAGRTHQEAAGALADRRRWALGAHRAALAVAAAVARGRHLVVDEGDLAGERTFRRRFQRGQVGEAHDLRFDRAGRAAAQRGDLQRLRMRADHRCALAATHPLRERHRLGPDAVEAQLLELRLRPGDRARIGFAARQARSDLGGQRFGDLPAGVVGQRAFAQLFGLGQGPFGNACFGGGRRGGEAEQYRNDRGGGKQGEAHHGLRQAIRRA